MEKGTNVICREGSIPALIIEDKTINDLYSNHSGFRGRLLKTAVCLALVANRYGAFHW